MQITAMRPPGATGVSGQGPVVTLTFMAKAAGQAHADHRSRRRTRSGHAGHACRWRHGNGYNSIERLLRAALGSWFSALRCITTPPAELFLER